ncbi:MAG: AraC family transcriptional regulator [Bacteroidota bacterium]
MALISKIHGSTAVEIISQLGRMFKTSIEQDCQRYTIELPDRIGQGKIYAYNLSDGLNAIFISGNLREDWSLQISNSDKHPVQFLVMGKGTAIISSHEVETDKFFLEPLQSSISASTPDKTQRIQFPKNEDILFGAILINESFFKDIDCETLNIPEDLLEVANNLSKHRGFLFTEIFHLPIVNALTEIDQQEDRGMVNSTFAASKIYEILYLQLEVYKSYAIGSKTASVKPEKGLTNVRNAEEILSSRLHNPPTIPELAKMVGINQQTLKKGFKQIYGSTINKYVNKKRLDQAAILVKTGDLQLKQIALEVGYNNPAYFSRRFKERFGVSPRIYQQRAKNK